MIIASDTIPALLPFLKQTYCDTYQKATAIYFLPALIYFLQKKLFDCIIAKWLRTTSIKRYCIMHIFATSTVRY